MKVKFLNFLNIKNNRIEYKEFNHKGSSGSPFIKRYNNLIVGMHFGLKGKKE